MEIWGYPCSVTGGPIDTKFGMGDYVEHTTQHTNLGYNWVVVVLSTDMWNITHLGKVTFLFFLFSWNRLQTKPVGGFLCAIAQTTRNFGEKCLLGVRITKSHLLPLFCLQTPKYGTKMCRIYTFVFPPVVQKRQLGEVGKETICSSQQTSGMFLPKLIKIGQCLTKLWPTVEGLFFSDSQCSAETLLRCDGQLKHCSMPNYLRHTATKKL